MVVENALSDLLSVAGLKPARVRAKNTACPSGVSSLTVVTFCDVTTLKAVLSTTVAVHAL